MSSKYTEKLSGPVVLTQMGSRNFQVMALSTPLPLNCASFSLVAQGPLKSSAAAAVSAPACLLRNAGFWPAAVVTMSRGVCGPVLAPVVGGDDADCASCAGSAKGLNSASFALAADCAATLLTTGEIEERPTIAQLRRRMDFWPSMDMSFARNVTSFMAINVPSIQTLTIT
ncbi:hypothetical protein [Novosphingobium sp.]|uniref:hypothetical protein n=1 Tax=Novosphingobium sp. TaxID=1874826 RepID=UPI002627866E|nr:hypothetical protein [Novosphingobium sp.]